MAAKRTVRLGTYEKKQVEKAAAFVVDHLAAPLDAATVALEVGLSVYKLKAGFPLLYGQAFAAYVWEQRMRRAEHLLRDTNELIAEVGKQCGYPHESTFYRAFKRWKGLTPDAFRNH